jgi:hypothetical protein
MTYGCLIINLYSAKRTGGHGTPPEKGKSPQKREK